MILIRAGTLVTAESSFNAEILIEGETIRAIGPLERLPRPILGDRRRVTRLHTTGEDPMRAGTRSDLPGIRMAAPASQPSSEGVRDDV